MEAVDQIGEASNSVKGNFYHFFDTKEDLPDQVLDNLWGSNELVLEKTFSRVKPLLGHIRDKFHRVYTMVMKYKSPQRKYRHMQGSSSTKKLRKRPTSCFLSTTTASVFQQKNATWCSSQFSRLGRVKENNETGSVCSKSDRSRHSGDIDVESNSR